MLIGISQHDSAAAVTKFVMGRHIHLVDSDESLFKFVSASANPRVSRATPLFRRHIFLAVTQAVFYNMITIVVFFFDYVHMKHTK